MEASRESAQKREEMLDELDKKLLKEELTEEEWKEEIRRILIHKG